MRFAIGFTSIVILVIAAGCGHSPRPGQVTPDMRRFAQAHYEPLVRAQLQSGTEATIHPPAETSVEYDPSDDLSTLIARGNLDTHRHNGTVDHGWYLIRWTQHGDAAQNDSDEGWNYERCVIANR